MNALALSATSVNNLARVFFGAGFSFVVIKLVSALIQNVLSRGDYRNLPNTWAFRIIYVAGKVTPSLAAACFCIGFFLRHDYKDAWVFGTLAIAIAALAIIVVRLRKQGRFFGIFATFPSRQQNR